MLTGCPRIAKNHQMRNKGEYKIRPYKRFRDACRGSAGISCSPGILGRPVETRPPEVVM
jgi:hypothetical protein